MHRMDANLCACETSRSQLSHAQGFISISLAVASEYSFENVEILKCLKISPEFTSFSCIKLKGQSDQLWVQILVRWKDHGLNFFLS